MMLREFLKTIKDDSLRHKWPDNVKQAVIAACYSKGTPYKSSGGQGAVVKLVDPGKKEVVAYKCFFNPKNKSLERYRAIGDIFGHLRMLNFKCVVETVYHEKGIPKRIDANKVEFEPAVQMAWVDGEVLLSYLQSNMSNIEALRRLPQIWLCLLDEFRRIPMAHGDLHADNVLIQLKDGKPNVAVSVDYDGVFFNGISEPAEGGAVKQNYQHPKRSSQHYDLWIDYFPGLLIYLVLEAIVRDPQLIDACDETRMVFIESDFVSAGSGSATVSRLKALFRKEPNLLYCLEQLLEAAQNSPEKMLHPLDIISHARLAVTLRKKHRKSLILWIGGTILIGLALGCVPFYAIFKDKILSDTAEPKKDYKVSDLVFAKDEGADGKKLEQQKEKYLEKPVPDRIVPVVVNIVTQKSSSANASLVTNEEVLVVSPIKDKVAQAYKELTGDPSESTWLAYVQAIKSLTDGDIKNFQADISALRSRGFDPYQLCVAAWRDYTNQPSPTAWQALERAIEPFEQKKVIYEPAEIALLRTNGYAFCRSAFSACLALTTQPSRGAWERLETALQPFEHKGVALFEPGDIRDMRKKVYWPYLGFISNVTGTEVKSVVSLKKDDAEMLSALLASTEDKAVITGLTGLAEIYRQIGDNANLQLAERKLAEVKGFEKSKALVEDLKQRMQTHFVNGEGVELEAALKEFKGYKDQPVFDPATADLFSSRLSDLNAADEAFKKAELDLNAAEKASTVEQWKTAKGSCEVALKAAEETEYSKVIGAAARITLYKSLIDKCDQNGKKCVDRDVQKSVPKPVNNVAGQSATKPANSEADISWEFAEIDVKNRSVKLRLRESAKYDAANVWVFEWGDNERSSWGKLEPGKSTVPHTYKKDKQREYTVSLLLKSAAGAGIVRIEKMQVVFE